MSEVVTNFVRSYVAENGTLPLTSPGTDDSPTETAPSPATKGKQGKGSKEVS